MLNKTSSPNYGLSKIDKIFYSLYGFYPNKEGQSYELLVGSVLKILNPDKKVIWDERVKGEFDENNYQIDVSLYEISDGNVMIETKDHTKDVSKVTRPEIDKIAGSLIEVNYESGYFFSATDYTRDAKKKSKGSIKNPNTKNISLFHLRESIKSDEENRIRTFILNISSIDIDNSKTKIAPKLTEEDVKILFPSITDKIDMKSVVQFFFENTFVECHAELYNDSEEHIGFYYFNKIISDNLFSLAKNSNYRLQGEWKVDEGFFETENGRIDLDEIQYDIGFKDIKLQSKISSKGEPMLLVKSEDSSINKLITDNQLKGIGFEDSGEITFDGSKP